MSKKPPVSELEFIKIAINHAEFASKLSRLSVPHLEIAEYAKHVCEAWFHLGEEHLTEAEKLKGLGCKRALFSRAYYAAYNASKAVRYMSKGFVSLKGDDHGKASSELPDAFPDVENWGNKISSLYENRLRADYDNWTGTNGEYTMTAEDAFQDADSFLSAARSFLNSKFGMQL